MRPVVLAALLVIGLTSSPWAINTIYPPAGQTFLGTFYFVDDFYNYLSYAQQAEDGAFLFANKAILGDHPAALVNLEWWVVGTLSRVLGGGHLLLAYRLFGVAAALCFLFVLDKWLARVGVSTAHRLPALLLVSLGGGLGGLLFTFAGRAPADCQDFFTGLFPFVGFLTNPHFTAGTALLLTVLILWDDAGDGRAYAIAALVATILALVRPYDFVMLVLVHATAVFLLEPARRFWARLLPLLALLPVVAYLCWLFYLNPAFAFYSGTTYVFPPFTDFLWALGPAVLLATGAAFAGSAGEACRRARVYLSLWAAFALLVIVVRPVGFSLQFLVGLGVPLLALGAVALGRFKPNILWLATFAFSLTFGVALNFMLTPRSFWLTRRDTMAVVETLRLTCRKGDILFAPPEVGLFAHGLTACRALVSHPISPDYDERLHDLERFARAQPADRRALLDGQHVRHLVLPGDPGPTGTAWLGPESGWKQVAVFGSPTRLSLYTRR